MPYVSTRAVNLPSLLFLDLELHLLETRRGIAPDTFISELLAAWLASETARVRTVNDGGSIRGYQWGPLFLPEGTLLRTSQGDAVEYATVEGERIVHRGSIVSPSRFANLNRRGRNAWRLIWLRFPSSEQWKRAGDCRTSTGRRIRRTDKTG